jgi:uncharacterized protein YpmB
MKMIGIGIGVIVVVVIIAGAYFYAISNPENKGKKDE